MDIAEKLGRARSTPGELAGQVAVVTGAAKGLGAAICDALAADGADIVLAARDYDALSAHARHLDQAYPHRSSMTIACDVTSEPQVEDLLRSTVEQFGGLDILVNAAGIIGPIETPAHEVRPEQFRQVIEVNLVGSFLTCRAAIPRLIERGRGRIVNIAGTSALRGYRNRVSYSSSKWALRGLTRTLALELGQYGITVNAVCPNVTHGERMETIVREKARRIGKTPEEVYADFANQTALGRFIEDVDVAATVRFLVSEGARNITGHEIAVDAGWDV
jgi:NAD(P)-dependent dehydrogenase (short-subunit alcohol dehydrogenase family)